MQWTLRNVAIVDEKNYVRRFADRAADAGKGERVLPVVAEADPPFDVETEELWGPEYEVLPDRVRAYCKVMPLNLERLLDKKIAKLEALEARLTAIEARSARV